MGCDANRPSDTHVRVFLRHTHVEASPWLSPSAGWPRIAPRQLGRGGVGQGTGPLLPLRGGLNDPPSTRPPLRHVCHRKNRGLLRPVPHLHACAAETAHGVMTLPLGCAGGPGGHRLGGPLETRRLARDEPEPDTEKSPSASALQAPREGGGGGGGLGCRSHRGRRTETGIVRGAAERRWRGLGGGAREGGLCAPSEGLPVFPGAGRGRAPGAFVARLWVSQEAGKPWHLRSNARSSERSGLRPASHIQTAAGPPPPPAGCIQVRPSPWLLPGARPPQDLGPQRNGDEGPADRALTLPGPRSGFSAAAELGCPCRGTRGDGAPLPTRGLSPLAQILGPDVRATPSPADLRGPRASPCRGPEVQVGEMTLSRGTGGGNPWFTVSPSCPRPTQGASPLPGSRAAPTRPGLHRRGQKPAPGTWGHLGGPHSLRKLSKVGGFTPVSGRGRRPHPGRRHATLACPGSPLPPLQGLRESRGLERNGVLNVIKKKHHKTS